MDKSEKNPADKWNRRRTDQVRLESWKAIANYLNRSVRTVRRWEVVENLPVYRHKHTKGHSVHAYCSELDAWRMAHAKGSSQGEPPWEAPQTRPPSTEATQRQSTGHLAKNVAVLVVAAFIGGMAARFMPLDLSNSPNETRQTWQTRQDAADVIIVPLSDLDGFTYWSESLAQAVVAPVMSAWIDSRLEDVVQQNRQIAEQLPRFPQQTQRYVVDYLVDFSLALGRIEDASQLVTGVEDRGRRRELQARIFFAAGDKAAMGQLLQEGGEFVDISTPLFMAMTGLFDEAIELNSRLESNDKRQARQDLILAMAAVANEDTTEAESRLKSAIDQFVESDQGYFFVALDMLSRMRHSEGRLGEAIGLLEETMAHRDVAAAHRSAFFWLMCQRQLAALYREAGREPDALKLENELRNRLTLADKTFPLGQSLAGA